MAKSYLQKLRDPRWREKRLEILERAEYSCENCQSEERLCVHHNQYEYGLDPWDYDSDYLVCLCRDCHQEAELVRQMFKFLIAQVPFWKCYPAIKELVFASNQLENEKLVDDIYDIFKENIFLEQK
jgi:hypothetical protein